MRLALEWTLENRPTPLQVRVTAEVIRRAYESGAVDVEFEDIQAQDGHGRPVSLSPEEERAVETALLQDAERVEWCFCCGEERAVKFMECEGCLKSFRRRA